MNDLKKLLYSETFFFVTQSLRFDSNKLFAIVFALFLLFSDWSKPCFTRLSLDQIDPVFQNHIIIYYHSLIIIHIENQCIKEKG